MALTILTAGLAACGLLLLLGLRAQIIWIDRGLTPEGQEAAARLLRDAAGEQLCAAGQAAEYLERLGAFEA